VQPTLSSHSTALQQARQPTPGQQCAPAAQPSILHFPAMQVFVVHGSPSSQPASFVHCTVGVQPPVGLQVLSAGHLVESGVNVQTPFVQALLVQPTASSHSLAAQHRPQLPPGQQL